MPPYIVVDACVAGAWSFNEVDSIRAHPVLDAIVARRVIAVTPDRFVEEFLRVCQKKTLPPPEGASIAPHDAWLRFLDVATSFLSFVPSCEFHERAWELALLSNLTTHDALYLAVAERWGAELWTLDDKLADPASSRFAPVCHLRHRAFPY